MRIWRHRNQTIRNGIYGGFGTKVSLPIWSRKAKRRVAEIEPRSDHVRITRRIFDWHLVHAKRLQAERLRTAAGTWRGYALFVAFIAIALAAVAVILVIASA